MQDKQKTRDTHFNESELSEILYSFEQSEHKLTQDQLEKIQKAWQKVERKNLYNKESAS